MRAPLHVLAAILISIVGFTPRVNAAQPPNVLLILADDQTWHDVGCYGNKDVKTPNIDRLATQGMKFTHSFTATAMCSPTRQQLYTGLFPVRNGAYPNHSKVHRGTKSIVHYLKALGYRVGLSGKWHIGPPASFPFERIAKNKVGEFINRDKDQPYCLILCSSSPHLPWNQGDASAYDPKKLTLPPFLVDTPETRVALTKYYAEITDFDREVGQAMKQVEKSGSSENTIFIYTSEQGAQFPRGKWTCYDTGLRTSFVVRWPEKVKAGAVSDAMIQYVDVVPTLIEAAGGKPIKGLDGISFLPVLLGKKKEHRDYVYGVHTTRGIIRGSKSYPVRSIRTRDYKLILNLNSDVPFQNILTAGADKGSYWTSWKEKAKTDKQAAALVERYQNRPAIELYDVRKDTYELENLAGNKEHQQLIVSLKAKLESWMKQQGDKGVETELKANDRKKNPKKKNS